MKKILILITSILLSACQTTPITVKAPLPPEPDTLKANCPKLDNMTYDQTYTQYITVLQNQYYDCKKEGINRQNFIDMLEK